MVFMNERLSKRPASTAPSLRHLGRGQFFPQFDAKLPGAISIQEFFRAGSIFWQPVLRPRQWFGWAGCVLALLAFPASAQPSVAPEYNVKAGFLARFVQYTVWPESIFPTTNSPIVIGVLGANPFGDVLEKTARDETAGRPLRVLHVDNLEAAAKCQLVFISKQENEHEAGWLAALRGLPILTVGESGHTIERGGILQFNIAGDRVRFDANWTAMKEAGLKISSPMLVSARKVFNAPDDIP